MKKQLHSGAKWSFRIGAYVGFIFLGFFLSWFVMPIFAIIGSFLFAGSSPSIGAAFLIIIFGAILYIAFVLIAGEIYARMAYNRWFYEFTEDQLRMERGIIWKRYSNIPYQRVQNVDITRGIIARILGFSTVNIQTAGFAYAAKGGAWSEGHIPAVSQQEAEHIREFLMKKISRRGQGL